MWLEHNHILTETVLTFYYFDFEIFRLLDKISNPVKLSNVRPPFICIVNLQENPKHMEDLQKYLLENQIFPILQTRKCFA